MKTNGSLIRLVGLMLGAGGMLCLSLHANDSVRGDNPPPRVEIVRPAAGQMFPASADIEIAVVARDPNGWVPRVEFFANGESIGVAEIVFIRPPPPGELQHFSMVWSNVPPGRYELVATATDDAGAMTRSGAVGISVLEPCRLPVVTLTVEDSAAAECDPRILAPHGACQARFRVTRSCATNRELTVLYSVSGTASNGVDYPEMPGLIVIPAGAFSADIWVDPIDDAGVEGTETVRLCLQAPDCLASDPVPLDCYLTGRQSCAVAFIQDNDVPPNQPPAVALIHPPDGSVLPAGEPLRLVATATDADGFVQTVEFFAGTNSLGVVPGHPWIIDPAPLPEPLAVSAALDANILPIPVPRGFTLIWSNPPPGEHKLSAVATDNAGASTRSEAVGVLVIEQPRPQVVGVLARDPEGGEGPLDDTLAARPDPAAFAVVRQGPTNEALTVYYRLGGTASNGLDYARLPHSVVIPAGAVAAPVVIEPIDDALVEGSETVTLTILPPICPAIYPPPPDCYLVGRDHTARAVIHDNDSPANHPPRVRLVAPAEGQVFRAPADIELIAFAQDAESGFELKVEFFEGTNSLGAGTFNPTRCAEICPNFILTWSNVPPGCYVLTASATDGAGVTTLSAPVEIKVVEDSRPAVVNIRATDPEGREVDPRTDQPENPAVFTVSRSGPTNEALTVHYRISGSAGNGVDYERLSGHVRMPAGATTAEIGVNVIDDSLCEGSERVHIELLPPICVALFPPPADCHYVVGPEGAARAVIHDNEECPPNQPPRVALVRPQDGDVLEAPGPIALCAAVGDADGFVRSVEFFANHLPIGMVLVPRGEETVCLRWGEVRPGSYVLTARATDNLGVTTLSEPVHVRVLERHERVIVTIHATRPETSEPSANVRVAPGVFTVLRTGSTAAPLPVFYTLAGTARNGADYRELSGRVEIPAGAATAEILVMPIDDNLAEGTETVSAALEEPACIAIYPPPPECYAVGTPGRATVVIHDNDVRPNVPPHVAILMPDEGSTFTAGEEIEIVTTAQDPDGWVSRVDFFADGELIGSDEIVFIQPPPPGELQTFRFVWRGARPGAHALTARATDQRGASTTSGVIHIRVIDPCREAVVSVTARDPIATETNPLLDVLPDTATFVVRRTCRFDEALAVRYAVSGTASNGVDYRRLEGLVWFRAGEEAAEIVVDPLWDRLAEGVETVVLELRPGCCECLGPLPLCYHVGRESRAVAYIRDDPVTLNHRPRVAITSPPAGQVFESPANIPVMALAVDPDGWVPRVDFYANNRHIGYEEIVFIREPDPGQEQTFTIHWENVPPGRYALTAKATDNQGAMTVSEPVVIEVTETSLIPTVNIVAVDPFAREGTTNAASFRVRRTGPVEAPLTVHYAVRGSAENGVDYVEIPTSVTIPAGRRSARIHIQPLDDQRVEGIETVVLRLHPAALYNVGRPGVAAAIICDNDQPRPGSRRLHDGLVHFCRPAANGFAYRLEVSSDLRHWEPLFTNVVAEDVLQFVDPEAPEHSQRFYRVIPDVVNAAWDD